MMIRPAQTSDIPEIMRIMDAAKQIMRASGNMNQWNDAYPSPDVIQKDINLDGAFVIVEEENEGHTKEQGDRIVAYFAVLPSPEPTYAQIYQGQWVDDTMPYHVVHRIASVPDVHGIFKQMMDYSFALDGNIRIDTHRENNIMQHNLKKYGFAYCGIILLANGDERLAYQKKI